MANRWGGKWKQWQSLLSWAPKSLWKVTAAMILEHLCSLEEKQCQPKQHITKQRHHFANKGPYSQSCGFSSSHVYGRENHKEGWVVKNWCLQTVVLENSYKSLGQQGVKPVTPKGNQPWIFIGRIVTEAEAPILWLPDVKHQFTAKDPDGGKDWSQKKRTAEEEMVK